MALFNPADIQPSPAPRRLAVAAAEDETVLSAAAQAYAHGLAVPILCGSREKIRAIAETFNIDIAPFELVDCPSPRAAVAAAVSLVRENRADVLMKGLVQTADLLRAVLDRDSGLRGEGVLSHVSVLDSPILKRRFLLTDAAMVTYPDLKTKAALIKNAVRAAQGLGIQNPKVAVIAPVEVVNPDMPATLDAAALTAMNRRGQITGCVVDGPLAMDLALSEEAARHKGVASDVAGRADILLVHNIDAGNATLKAFTHGGGCLFGGLVMGAKAPIVLNSRSDTDASKLFSISCAEAVSRLGQA
ncbi:phosphate butyryltransferase [Sporobacter termitidis DSM 10068]|uniref:Phosphate butyryltransferase n=1 Tax=Sporobacter termitidis DSM 10068 TaxID=1123282 RepID=A0A1M5UUR1_9FIRM|nr:bifunctional enoyl-CoA hydratase/phosphate acetyltransferase [Sporobacter termitidis]SHH66689.1 phosphate butyryltransferase [Sporobacter termitidis DSM 10068]